MQIGSGRKNQKSELRSQKRYFSLKADIQTSDIRLRTPFVAFLFPKQLLNVKFVIQTSHLL